MSYNLSNNITITADPVVHYRFDNLTDPVGTKIASALDYTGRENLTQSDVAKQPIVVGPSNPYITGVTAAYFDGNQMLKAELAPSDQLDETKEYLTAVVFEDHYDRQNNPINQKETMFCFGVSGASGNYGSNVIGRNNYQRAVEYRQGNNHSYDKKLYDDTTEAHRPHPHVVWFKTGINNTPVVGWLDSEMRPVSGSNKSSFFHEPGVTTRTDGDYNNIWVGNMDHPGSTTHDQGYHGRVYEVLLFDSDISDTDLDKLHDYLRDKYRFDGSYLVKDLPCNVYGPSTYSTIDVDDGFGLSHGELVNGKMPTDAQTIEYWIQFSGIAGDRNNYRHDAGHYYEPVLEGVATSTIRPSGRAYYNRHTLRLKPQTGYAYFYASPYVMTYIYLHNKQWYHVKIARDQVNETYWRSRIWVNGLYQGQTSINTYKYTNAMSTTFGDHPARKTYVWNDHDGEDHLPSDELPTMRIAGYRVVNELLDETNEYETTYGTLTSVGFARPDERTNATTSTGRVAPEDIGAAVDMRIQTAGPSKPALLGKYEMTTPKWGGTHTYTSKLITNLDHITYVPNSEKTFKNTLLNFASNRLVDISGLRNLYSVTEGPGNDVPTAAKNITFEYNRLTDFSDVDNSPFTAGMHASYLTLANNPLKSLAGVGSCKLVRYLNASYTYALTSIDDLHRAQWTYYDTNINVSYGNISSVNTKALTGMGTPTGTGGLSMQYNALTSFNNLESNLSTYNLSWQRATIHDISTGVCPRMYQIQPESNYFQNTSLPADIATHWPRLASLYMNNTNIEDISALALCKEKEYGIGGITYLEQHTVTNLPLCAYAGFYSFMAAYHQNVHEFAGSDHGTPTTSNRDTGFTAKYNAGERIFVYGQLNLSYSKPTTDLRIFKDSYHGFDYTSNYNHLRPDIHYVYLIDTNVTNTANGLGVLKNFANCCSVNLSYNDFTSIDAMFADTGFADASWDRAYFQSRHTYKYLNVSYCPNMTDLNWMLKANFAGVYHLSLYDANLDYADFLAIKTQLLALKANGDINLERIYLAGSVWDEGHKGGGYAQWNNAGYYNFEGTYYPGTTTSVYTRADGPFGFGDNPSPQQLLRKEFWDVGINLYFTNPSSSTNPHCLGNGDPDLTTSPYYMGVYPNPLLDDNKYRYGAKDVTGRLVWSETDGSTASASNTLTLDFSINYPMYSGGYILIKQLTGVGTATNASLPLAGSAASIFGNAGEWDQTAGTLKLTVATGQTLTHDVVRSISFTVTNPVDNSSPANATHGRFPKIDAFDHHGNERSTNYYLGNQYVMDIEP